MIIDDIRRWKEAEPFKPFTLILTNGREIHVPHSDFVVAENAVMSVNALLPTGQLEEIDSIPTFHISELPTI